MLDGFYCGLNKEALRSFVVQTAWENERPHGCRLRSFFTSAIVASTLELPKQPDRCRCCPEPSEDRPKSLLGQWGKQQMNR